MEDQEKKDNKAEAPSWGWKMASRAIEDIARSKGEDRDRELIRKEAEDFVACCRKSGVNPIEAASHIANCEEISLLDDPSDDETEDVTKIRRMLREVVRMSVSFDLGDADDGDEEPQPNAGCMGCGKCDGSPLVRALMYSFTW